MKLPQLTAERAIGPAAGIYVRAAIALGSSPDVAVSRQRITPQMLAAQQPWTASDEAASRTLVQVKNDPCYPQLTCRGQGAHAGQHVCCDPATSQCGLGADNTPVCAPRVVRNTLNL